MKRAALVPWRAPMPTMLDFAKEIVDGVRAQPPILVLLGARLTAIDSGRARIELAADERLANPMGTLHGGVLCDIADAAMGMAFASTLAEGESFTTLELKINSCGRSGVPRWWRTAPCFSAAARWASPSARSP